MGLKDQLSFHSPFLLPQAQLTGWPSKPVWALLSLGPLKPWPHAFTHQCSGPAGQCLPFTTSLSEPNSVVGKETATALLNPPRFSMIRTSKPYKKEPKPALPPYSYPRALSRSRSRSPHAANPSTHRRMRLYHCRAPPSI